MNTTPAARKRQRRELGADDAAQRFADLMAAPLAEPPQRTDPVDRTNAAHAADWGWSLAAVLGWLDGQHPDLAGNAAAIVQRVLDHGRDAVPELAAVEGAQ
jgi:hypothetical protein